MSLSFVESAPTADLGLARGGRSPCQLPNADALFAIEIDACSDKFVADPSLDATRELRGLRRWVGTRVNACDLKFGCDDTREDAQIRLQLADKSIASERNLAAEFVLVNFEHRIGAHYS